MLAHDKLSMTRHALRRRRIPETQISNESSDRNSYHDPAIIRHEQ